MAKLSTWGFLKLLGRHAIAGDPMAIVDDIAKSANDDEKASLEKDAIEVSGEGQDEKA